MWACAVMTIAAQQASGLITGQVVDAQGEPLIGANVMVTGSKMGVNTNQDGYYQLDVKPGTKLEISYIGYKTQQVEAKQGLVTTLEENTDYLDEVVVVGYGTQRKSDLTGGVVSVGSEKLDKVTTNNLLDKLQGQMPGVKITTTNANPGQEQSIRVRGENSISASNSPLIVLDGIPYSGALGDIDPDAIENITVLKDASAAAIYGSRGSNGVILIQSKKGTIGKAIVNYKGQIGFREPQKRLNVMNAAEYVKFRQDYHAQLYGWSGDQLDPMNVLRPNERISYNNGEEVDWQDVMYRKALTHNNQISISGGTDATKYNASLSHTYEEGIMKNTGLKRTNLTLNVTQELNSWLTIGIGAMYVKKDIDSNAPYLQSGLKQSPLGIFRDENGRYVDYPMNETMFYNPMANIDAIVDNTHNNFFISSFAEVKFPVKGLTFRTNYGYNFRNSESGSYYGRNTLSGKSVDGSASISNSSYNDYTWENILRYNRLFFDKHRIDLTGLFSMQETHSKSSSQSAECFVNDDSGYHNMNAGEKNQKVSSSITETSTMSYMFRLNYGYDDRYLLTLTGRGDGYSAFGANNKWAFFPSAALAWNMAYEEFMSNLRDAGLTQLKVRLSYGANGNQAINAYQTLDRLGLCKYIWGDGGTTANGSYLPSNGVGNPNLKWETTHTWNLGIDFAMLGGRLTGNVDLYVANTSDLLMSRQVPIMNGFSSIMDNIGKTRNKGIEIALNSINISNRDFTWSTNVNFSLNRDKIIDLRGDGKDDISNNWFIGQPLRVYYDYNVVGVYQENDPRWDASSKKFLNADGKEIQKGAKPGSAMLEDVNNDGVIDAKDKKVIGSKLPSFLLSMGNTLEYKGLSCSIFLDGVFGMTKERLDLNLERWGFGYSYLSGYDYWTPERPSNEITGLTYSPFNKHTWYKKVNYVQVKNITIGYTFKKEWIRKIGIQGLNINASVNNLCSFSNVKNTTNLDNDNMYYSYPTNRSYMFGLNLTL